MVVSSVGGLLWFYKRRAVVKTGNERPLIAVMYFDNYTDDPKLDWLGRGLTEMLTTDLAQVRTIAQAKMKDLNANDVDAAMQMIMGSARSMGIEVKG